MCVCSYSLGGLHSYCTHKTGLLSIISLCPPKWLQHLQMMMVTTMTTTMMWVKLSHEAMWVTLDIGPVTLSQPQLPRVLWGQKERKNYCIYISHWTPWRKDYIKKWEINIRKKITGCLLAYTLQIRYYYKLDINNMQQMELGYSNEALKPKATFHLNWWGLQVDLGYNPKKFGPT